MTNLSEQLKDRYKQENLDPSTGALAEHDGKVFWTCEGMELKATKTGLLAGKSAVKFKGETTVINPFHATDTLVPKFAIASYSRFCMDQICEFQSDPVKFDEYAKLYWHYKYPYMYLAKVARSRALRHAFPELFVGTISYEEASADLNFSEKSKDEDNRNKISGSPSYFKSGIETEMTVTTISTIPEIKTSVSDLVRNVFKQ